MNRLNFTFNPLIPAAENEQAPERQGEKDEEWPNKNPQTQQNAEVSYYTRVGGVVYRSRGGSSGKECRRDTVRAGHRFGYNGSLSDMERGAGPRRGGRKRRGGWHHFAFRDRQQLQRKLKKRNMTYVEEERQRGLRFSEEENEVLVASVLTHYRELCCHSSIKGSTSRKRRLWQEVVNEVNSVAKTYRTIEVCKKRYADCRRAVKVKMAALEQQVLGRGDPHEQIRFNSWEDKLHQKMSALSGGGQWVLDTSELVQLELAGTDSPKTPISLMGSSLTPTVDMAASSIVQPSVSGEVFMEEEEATSPLVVQIVSEWSEEKPANILTESTEQPTLSPQPIFCPQADSSENRGGPEPASIEQHYQELQEEYSRSLRHMTQAQSAEVHKLRENVVEGNGRLVQHLEGLATEVRELNTHVRQIHLNQAHFNLMFQNYLSDTKQFYGAMIQAMRDLQHRPTVSPMASAAASPIPHTTTPPLNALLLTAVPDYSTMSPVESAEPASTTSEVPLYTGNRYTRRVTSTFHPQPPNTL